ncbi:uncharacterized protein LOC143574517 [Bidens hawaiensis]|uniref:uncharacterized protein LOC143574517 n=1 Tax=Bidens hawaiensis TaxID=980011 RepID=UPI00404B123B
MNVLSLNIRGLGNSGKADWVRGLRNRNEVSFIMIQETQYGDLDTVDVARFWGSDDYLFDWVPSNGRSGGLLSIWDPKVFVMGTVSKFSNCLLISGNIKGSGVISNMLNVYAPQSLVDKRALWGEIGSIIGDGDGFWTVAGDFNSVRNETERRNSNFNSTEAKVFNEFIDHANLHELSLNGRSFTFVAGNKMSRIDRIFVNWNFLMEWPTSEYLALDRYKSDHSPLILKTVYRNFGPKPFRFYNSWIGRDSFGQMVRQSIKSGSFSGAPDTILMLKFKKLRHDIKIWIKDCKEKEFGEKRILEKELFDLNAAMESRDIMEEEVWIMEETKCRIRELEEFYQKDLKQKARSKWASYGDDNSRYFHGCINKRKVANQLPGLMVVMFGRQNRM